jgi:taurine transport system substrate-binding protein
MKNNKLLPIFLLMFSLLFCCNACTKSSIQSHKKIIKIGILDTPNDVAVARKANFFNKALPNYEIKYITFDSGVDANKALMSNSIDFATMGDTNALVAVTRNIPVKLFFINEICQTNEELIVRKDANIHSIKQLAGKRIATPFASTSHLSLLYLLNLEYLQNKVTLLDMDTQNIVAAWKRRQIDAAYTWEPTLTQLKKDGIVLTSSKELEKQGMMTGNVTLVSNRFAREHPKECLIIRNELVRAHQMRSTHSSKAVTFAAKQVGIPVNEAKKQMLGTYWPSLSKEKSYLKYSGRFLNAMKKAGSFMYKNQNLEYAPDEKQLYEFVWKGWKDE